MGTWPGLGNSLPSRSNLTTLSRTCGTPAHIELPHYHRPGMGNTPENGQTTAWLLSQSRPTHIKEPDRQLRQASCLQRSQRTTRGLKKQPQIADFWTFGRFINTPNKARRHHTPTHPHTHTHTPTHPHTHTHTHTHTHQPRKQTNKQANKQASKQTGGAGLTKHTCCWAKQDNLRTRRSNRPRTREGGRDRRCCNATSHKLELPTHF